MSTEDTDDTSDDTIDTIPAGQEEIDILSLSDDELDAHFAKQQDAAADTSKDDDKNEEEEDNSDVEEDDDSEDEGSDEEEDSADDLEEDSDDDADTDDDNLVDDEDGSGEEDDDTDETLSAEDQIKDLLSPFRANNKDIQVSSVEEARTLMQLGAGYYKNMKKLKPALKMVKMLEQNNLMDEDKLSYLIDVSKNDPKAIAKLLADADIDPVSLNVESPGYEPKDHSVSDNQMVLEDALDVIKGSETESRTIDIITNQWDAQSRQTILNAPDIIPVIDQQIENGIYDKIVTEVDKERMLGKLKGLNDIQAYKVIGEKMTKAGQLSNGQKNSKQKPAAKKAVRKVDEKTRNKRRKALRSTKSTPAKKKQNADFNPLNMSDEEFGKLNIAGLT